MRKMLVVAALGMLPACSLTGFGGDDSVASQFQTAASGNVRILTAVGVGEIDVNGDIVTYTAGGPNFRGETLHSRKVIRAFRQTRAADDHGGFDSGYPNLNLGYIASSHEPHHKPAVMTHETRDTNKDGFINAGDSSAGCGITLFIDSGTNTPGSALFADVSTCVKGRNVGDFFVGSNESVFTGALVAIEKDKNKNSPNGLFENLPFASRVRLLNSINTQKDVVRVSDSELVTLRITGIRLGEASYSPRNVSIEVVNMRNIHLNPRDAGMRMLMAWVADQAQAAVKRGERGLSGSITINDTVTLGFNELAGAMKFTKLNQATVDALRGIAGGGVMPVMVGE